MKLWKCVKPREVITIAELYTRYHGHYGDYYDHKWLHEHEIPRCRRLKVLSCTASLPYRVTRNATFLEKLLDKIKRM